MTDVITSAGEIVEFLSPASVLDIDEVVVRCARGGTDTLTWCAIDRTHVMMVRNTLPVMFGDSPDSEEFVITDIRRIAASLRLLPKYEWVKLSASKGLLKLEMGDNFLTFPTGGQVQTPPKFPELYPIESEAFDLESPEALAKAVKFTDGVSDAVALTASDGNLSLSAKKGAANVSMVVCKVPDFIEERTLFSAEFFSKIVKILSKDKCSVHLCTDKPIQIKQGGMTVLLAPRIEDDDL